ncbi:MAG: hypothetical protein AB7H86_06940 [Blastocatellales bacterium]
MLAAALQVEQLKLIFERIGPAHDRLVADLEDAWRTMEDLLRRQIDRIDRTEQAASAVPGLELYQSKRSELSGNIFGEAHQQWEAHKPYKRTLLAIDAFELNLAEIVGALPETIGINGRQMIDLLGEHNPGGWKSRLVRLRRKERPVRLAGSIRDQLRELSDARLRTIGDFLVVIARGAHQIRTNWNVARGALDSWAAGESDPARMAAAWRKEYRATLDLIRRGGEALDKIRLWKSSTVENLADRLLSSVLLKGDPDRAAEVKVGREECLSHWRDQLRAVESEMQMELSIVSCEAGLITGAIETLDELHSERSGLIAELDEFIQWLGEQNRILAGEVIPPARRNWVPAATRLDEWERYFRSRINQLPESVEFYKDFTPLPDPERGRKTVDPREIGQRAYDRVGRQLFTTVFKDLETANQRVVQSIEMAREVIRYGLEAEGGEPESDQRVREDALRNARSLLEHYRKETTDWQPEYDPRLAGTLARVFNESRMILSRDRLGILAHLFQQGILNSITGRSGRFDELAREILHRAYLWFLDRLESFQTYIGWKADVSEGEPEVITRSFLPDEYILDQSARQLPAIYRRLFNFDPIKDPRFLIGREREMEAIAEARRFWEAGRYVAVIIVGTRGSGKTSLINCALKTTLTDLDIIRGEFNRRLTTEDELRRYLADMFQIDDPANLESFLLEKKRVIIIEELERTYLRRTGAYGAVRALQRLIAATCSTTLWIIVTNRSAFRFLNSFVNLGKTFSHRINAANVSTEVLRKAILLRHNLSGLRLSFAPPPEKTAWNRRLLRQLPGQTDPEKIFFDVLARETEGVFRAAFEIWMGYIDRIDSGILYMKPLVSPDLRAVTGELDQFDLFSLAAILQHGSLTPEEHAAVFQLNISSSRAQMDEMVAREIIEPDPGRPGFRIRPEARRIVTETLYQHNLL